MQERKEYLTKKKFDELTAELKNMKNVKRKEIAEALDYADLATFLKMLNIMKQELNREI